MRKVINFGKIDGYNKGRKNCAADLEVELRDHNGIPELSICGNVWNTTHTDIIMGGQCLDSMLPYFKHNKLFNELYNYWKVYHLNCMHAGTKEQEEALANFKGSYTEQVEYLKSLNLYEVPYTGTGSKDGKYIYGTAWLTREIPDTVLNRIKEIIEEKEVA